MARHLSGIASTLGTFVGSTLSRTRFRGKARVSAWLGAAFAGASGVTCVPYRQAKVRLDLHDRAQRRMWTNCYEPEVCEALATLLGPGDTFLDIGAHIGYFSAMAADLVGPAGSVHAIEVNPQTLATLLENTAGLGNTHVHEVAAWSESGVLVSYLVGPAHDSGWGSMVWKDPSRQQIQVRTRTVDDWVDRVNLGRLDVVKMDTEGAEPHVLMGASRTIARWRPSLVLEADPVLLGASNLTADSFASQIRALGYDVFACGAGEGTFLCVDATRSDVLSRVEKIRGRPL